MTSRGMWLSSFQSGLLAARPTIYPGDADHAFYFATDENALFVATKPASGTTPVWRCTNAAPKLLTDADYTVDPADSGRPHIMPNVSADRTITLPAIEDALGCTFPFIAQVGAADGHDWIFATAATDELFAGGVFALDSDASPTVGDVIVADQSDDDRFQVNVPEGGTRVELTCDGTYWVASGNVNAAAFPAFS